MPLDTTPDSVARLIQALRYGEAPERRAALAELARIAPLGSEAVPDLISVLHDADASLRDGAADTLARMGPAAVAPLVAGMLDENVDFRKTVIVTLGRLGPDAAPAVPVLQAARTDPQLVACADAAMAKINPPPLAALRPHLLGTLPLALLITGAAGIVAGAAAVLLWFAHLMRAGNPLAVIVGAAMGLLGGFIGAVVGGMTRGRVGAMLGLVVLGMAGYLVGVFIGGLAGSLLGPLVR